MKKGSGHGKATDGSPRLHEPWRDYKGTKHWMLWLLNMGKPTKCVKCKAANAKIKGMVGTRNFCYGINPGHLLSRSLWIRNLPPTGNWGGALLGSDV